jgi:hypothetical protein
MLNPLDIVCIAGSTIICAACCLTLRPPRRQKRPQLIDLDAPRHKAQKEWNEKYTTEGAKKKKSWWGAPMASTASMELREMLADKVFGKRDEYVYRREGDRRNWGYGIRSSESDSPRYGRGTRGHVNSLVSFDSGSEGYVTARSHLSSESGGSECKSHLTSASSGDSVYYSAKSHLSPVSSSGSGNSVYYDAVSRLSGSSSGSRSSGRGRESVGELSPISEKPEH